MTFQIEALPEGLFAPLFALSDAALAARNARRTIAESDTGTPCRVSLEEASVGEEVLLLHYEHQPAPTPYRASHAIFVRKGARQARPAPGEIPPLLARRLISLRAFDERHDLVEAEVVPGAELKPAIERMLAAPDIAYLHLHNARQGCYHARAVRT